MSHHVMKRIRHSRRITVYPPPPKVITLEESGIRYVWMDFAYTIADKYNNYKKHCIAWFDEQIAYFDVEPDVDESAIVDIPQPKKCVLVIAGYPTKLVADLQKRVSVEDGVDCFVPFSMSKTRLSAIYNVLAILYDEITIVSVGIMNTVAMEMLHENGFGKVVEVIVISPIFAVNVPDVKSKIIVNGHQTIVERIEGNVTVIECKNDDIAENVFP